MRDSDEKWWKSWCGFNEQEIRRNAMGAFNLIGIVMNKAAEVGYMGPKVQAMFKVGKVACERYLRQWFQKLKISRYNRIRDGKFNSREIIPKS